MTNAYGTVTFGQAFDPFGRVTGSQGYDTTHYGFTGEWEDASGLLFLRARYYDAEQGRFVSRDPFPGYLSQPSTLNAYAYALNNPATLTDPSGEFAWLLVGAAALSGLIVGAGYSYGSQVADNLSQGMCFWDALTTNIDAGQVALYAGLGTVMGLGVGLAGAVGIQYSGILTRTLIPKISNIWPSPWLGRQIINGIEYSKHALERMMPTGLGGRGVPPSVIHNAIQFGVTQPGREPGTIMHIYENVIVITDSFSKIVITIIKTSH